MNKLTKKLLESSPETFSAQYAGAATAQFRSKDWDKHVRESFRGSPFGHASENVFRQAVDATTQWLVSGACPALTDASRALVLRGEALLLATPGGESVGELSGPAAFSALSDGEYSIVARFYRSLVEGRDKALVVDSDGLTEVYSKTKLGEWGLEESGLPKVEFALLRSPFAGIGHELAALQDRVTHSTVDQTLVAEMYTRPFWFLLNAEEAPPVNPYLGETSKKEAPTRQDAGPAGGRLITTSGPGPFGQLDPPDLNTVAAYHDTLIRAVERCSQVPPYLLWQGSEPPSGVALQLSLGLFLRRMHAYRAVLLEGVQALVPGVESDDLWPAGGDVLQALDDLHGLNLAGMGMPPEFIAQRVLGTSVVEYVDDRL